MSVPPHINDYLKNTCQVTATGVIRTGMIYLAQYPEEFIENLYYTFCVFLLCNCTVHYKGKKMPVRIRTPFLVECL